MVEKTDRTLTVDNFIFCIKNMDERERKKIRLQVLVEVILQIPYNNLLHNNQSDNIINTLYDKVNSLAASIELLQIQSVQNTALILNLKKSECRIKGTK